MAWTGDTNRIKVAVIGGGPAGLYAAVNLAKLPFIDLDLYEKRCEFSESGGGISLQPHTWRLLEHSGVAEHLSPSDYFRCPRGRIEQRR